MKFKNKNILITGGSSGIGKAFAQKCANDGANIIITARNEEKLKEVSKKLNCIYFSADVTDHIQVKTLFDFVQNKFKQLDLVLNNAGIGFVKPIYELDDNEIKSIIDVNLLGAILVAKYSAQIFIRQRFGHLINTSSLAGLINVKKWSVYCATKWGLTSFSDTIREELKNYNIKVTSIHPSAVNTEFFSKEKANIDLSKMKGTLSAQQVADAIYNASFTNKKRVLIPRFSYLAAFLYKIFPSLITKIIDKMEEKTVKNS